MWNTFLYIYQMTLSIKFIIDDNSTFSFNHPSILLIWAKWWWLFFFFFLFCFIQCFIFNAFIESCLYPIYFRFVQFPLHIRSHIGSIRCGHKWKHMLHAVFWSSYFAMEYIICMKHMNQQYIVISMANTNWKSTPLNPVCFSYPFIKWLDIGSVHWQWCNV